MNTENIHPSMFKRKIIHCDMDAFYAAVEIRDDPRLRDQPLVVGGSPDSRSVVCTASYSARKFGIRSAMPCSQAYKLCPSAIFIEPNFAKYEAVSQQLHSIFKRYTDIIEPVSLDEAYLDVTQNQLDQRATQLAIHIQKDIWKETSLTASLGVAPNKLVAKIASDLLKPRGITVVQPHEVSEFMKSLPIRKIPFIGPVTESKIKKLGIHTCLELSLCSLERLEKVLGNMGQYLIQRACGIDEEQVETERVRKSIGVESTFPVDILNIEALIKELSLLVRELKARIDHHETKGFTITLKVKYADFMTVTRCHTRKEPTNDPELIFDISKELLLNKTMAGQNKIRLLGISISHLVITS